MSIYIKNVLENQMYIVFNKKIYGKKLEISDTTLIVNLYITKNI